MNIIRVHLTLVLLTTIAFAKAQPLQSITGSITDAISGKPIPYASAFIANTLTGTNAGGDGTYKLTNVAEGGHELTFSCIGYRLRHVAVTITSEPQMLNVELQPDTRRLNEVTVSAKRLNYKKMGAVFENYFLGRTRNSLQCTITNLDRLDYEERHDTLLVYSGEPVIVKNEALGYTIYYWINQCIINQEKHEMAATGSVRFEELQPENNTQTKQWHRERMRAYYGSLNHLMRSFKFNCLQDDKFEIYLACPGDTLKIDPYILFSDEMHSQLEANCTLKIIYFGEHAEYGYARYGPLYEKQISYVRLLDRRVFIFDNGYYYNPARVMLSGYMGWSSAIPELLPLDYSP